MASLTILYWRDIPSQVIVKSGRSSAKRRIVGAFHSRDRRGGDARRREERRRLPCRMAARRAHSLRRRSGKRSSGRRRAAGEGIRYAPSGGAGQARWARRPALTAFLTHVSPPRLSLTLDVERSSRHLHALRQARRVRRRRKPARGRAGARRRSRFGLRRARHLRPLSGRNRRGRFRQARHSFERRSCDAVGRGRGPLHLETRAVSARPAARLPGQDLRRSRRRRAARKPGPPAGRSASAPRRIRSRSIPSCASTTSRSPSRTCTSRRAI